MAAITIREGLPFVSVVLKANSRQLMIENVLLDTGAAASVFRTDDLFRLGIVPTRTDTIRFMSGIGGVESVIEKEIEALSVGDMRVTPFVIQLGAVDYGFSINGIVGMDFLQTASVVIDLRRYTIT